jgi:hypothetical protein
VKVLLEHNDGAIACSLLREALGSASDDFVDGLLIQLANASPKSLDNSELHFALSVIKSVKPNDQLETMLTAQMVVTHMALMRFARKLERAETILEQDSAERAFNKLARTFAAQLEALKRYRTGGEQRVAVQHVSVSDGGQAIVGNVLEHPGRNKGQQPVNATPALIDARQCALPVVDALGAEIIPLPSKRE